MEPQKLIEAGAFARRSKVMLSHLADKYYAKEVQFQKEKLIVSFADRTEPVDTDEEMQNLAAWQ